MAQRQNSTNVKHFSHWYPRWAKSEKWPGVAASREKPHVAKTREGLASYLDKRCKPAPAFPDRPAPHRHGLADVVNSNKTN
jgi:hypothetical protein